MIAAFNSVLGRLFDVMLYPFQPLGPWITMIVLSLVTAVFMLLVYRLASDQAGIRTVKNSIVAHLLELRLYKDNLPVTFSAQGRILWCNLRYLLHSLRPMLFMAVPLTLAIIQLDLRFGHSPLEPGKATLLKVRLKEGHQPTRASASVEPSSGFVIETPPLRIDTGREVNWRLRAMTPGICELSVRVGGETVTKQLIVGTTGITRVSPARVALNWLDQLLNPGEQPIPESSAVESIQIDYPSRPVILSGWHLHWLVVYFGLSVLFGVALKGVLKVEA